MGVLASVIGAALATLPLIEETSTPLMPVRTSGAAWERFSVLEIPVPVRPPEHSHYRLRVAAPAVWLDGARLSPAEDGEFDLLNLSPKRPSRVSLAGWVTAAALIETPRVFIARHEILVDGIRLWVRNSLENTSNVYATVTAAGGLEVSASATVPPGYTQIVILRALPAGSAGPWRIVLEKQEEAMEGGYRFVQVVTSRTGPTVNTSVKP